MKSWTVLFLAIFALAIAFVGATPPALAQEKPQVAQDANKDAVPAVVATIDTKSLICEWWGDWTLDRLVTRGGKYYLTIVKIDDGKILVEAEITNASQPSKEKSEGTLKGSQLAFSTANRSATLIIEGDRMSGKGLGPSGYPYTINLMKVKKTCR